MKLTTWQIALIILSNQPNFPVNHPKRKNGKIFCQLRKNIFRYDPKKGYNFSLQKNFFACQFNLDVCFLCLVKIFIFGCSQQWHSISLISLFWLEIIFLSLFFGFFGFCSPWMLNPFTLQSSSNWAVNFIFAHKRNCWNFRVFPCALWLLVEITFFWQLADVNFNEPWAEKMSGEWTKLKSTTEGISNGKTLNIQQIFFYEYSPASWPDNIFKYSNRSRSCFWGFHLNDFDILWFF